MPNSTNAFGLSAGVVRVLGAVVVTTAWMFVSSYLILLNKHIMVDLKFRYPMTVAGMGMLTSGVLSFLCCRVFRLVDAKTPVTFEFWVKKCLPVGFFMAATLWTGNEVYLYLSVAFIQMLKAFTPVITMIALFIARLEDPTRAMILSVCITAAGTIMSAWGEVNLSVIGLVLMFSSETGEAIRLVMTQGLMYLAPACTFWLGIGAFVIDFPKIRAANAWQIVEAHPMQFATAAVLGFTVNGLAYTSIKLASSLTLKVLGTVKNALLVMFSVLFLGEIVTGLQATGYVVSLVGFAWYNKIKMTQIAHGDSGKAAAQSGAKRIEETRPLLNTDLVASSKEKGLEGYTTSPHTRTGVHNPAL